jgi:hypothetical protein
MKRFGRWLVAIVVIAAVGAGAWAYWNYDLRWRPKTITRNQAEIAKILETAGWVSPGLKGPKLYMVSFRTCPDCVRFKSEEYPGLHKAGVDTRLIEIARADRNGVPKSTPAERATVAEMWVNRSWALSEAWDATPVEAWTAAGHRPRRRRRRSHRRDRGRPQDRRGPAAAAQGQRRELRLSAAGLVDQGRQDEGLRLREARDLPVRAEGSRGLEARP